MSETTDSTSSVKNQMPVPVNDEVFSVTTRDEALRILEKIGKHSIVGILMQPVQNIVSGWLNIQFGPSVKDWAKTIDAREVYRSGILEHIPSGSVANTDIYESKKSA